MTCDNYMNINEIQHMFSEMGLETTEQREQLIKELSINMMDNNSDDNYEIKTSNNTLILEEYA